MLSARVANAIERGLDTDNDSAVTVGDAGGNHHCFSFVDDGGGLPGNRISPSHPVGVYCWYVHVRRGADDQALETIAAADLKGDHGVG